ncbi:glycoside hydrolase family 78 protein [Actinoplanes sp. NPDC051411]|uniref:glycoside hydrolase family 78 protein n=1 Tax=Actinoplanes sp. NPDC051411 TaxID=3155522 RepID=UPI0034181257
MPDLAAPTNIRFDHHRAGIKGIGTATPRISWQIPAAPDDYRQTAYEIEINGSAFPAESAEQILVPWPGAPLAAREPASVRVRVRDETHWSEWSEPATVEAGLLSPTDWSARFVSPRTALDEPAPILTGTVDLPADAIRARLYITAHGIYVARLNGHRVGDEHLAPGWTAYDHRLRYQTHDVTGLLRQGENRLEILLGNGWYRGRLGFQGRRALYGDRLAALAQLEVTTATGEMTVLATDGSWTARESPIVADDLYNGQHTDLRRRPQATAATQPTPVTQPAAEEAGVVGVDVLDADLAVLVAPDGPPVRVTQTLPAQAILTSPSGKTLVDFGQNLVGWVRLTTRGGRSGDTVTVRHAEVLEDGELGVRPLRTALATDEYVLAGPDEVTLEPELTFHGFRYAEVTGVPQMSATDVEAVVIGSDLERTGWFESSHELLDRFHENVVWGMRGNFVDVPTDCPQRDERLGWTGDIQVFSPTAGFLFDSAGFLTSWLADLAAEQQKDGSVPYVIPDVIRQPGPATAAWGDAATVVPWVLYQRFGDREILRRQLPSMRAWVDRMAALAGDDLLWAGGFQFGDWLDPSAPPDDPARAKANPDVIATAHLARSAEVVALAAAALAETAADTETAADAETAAKTGTGTAAGSAAETERTYAELAARVRQAFAREYATEGGRILDDAATSYALALQWALLPGEEQRARAGAKLADLVRTAGFRISTGFVGTPLMADALTDAGAPEVAYRLLLQTGCPSWLYPVTMGATTVWERWDSMLPDGSINPGQMTSFNHYALGAVADWMHRRVAGLAPDAPGYRRMSVRPVPTASLTHAAARHLTPYGEAGVRWERADGSLRLRVTVPVGVTATVHLPDGQAFDVRHGTHEFTASDPYGKESVLPAEASIRQLMDHRPSWDLAVAAAREAGVAADEAALASRLSPYLDAPASELVDAATGGEFQPGADTMRNLLREGDNRA